MRASLASRVVLGLALWAPVAHAAPSVWAIDDGEKIRRDATSTPFERGERNPVWRPGEPVRLFAMQNESVALQVVVEADDEPLDKVAVHLAELTGPGDAKLSDALPGGGELPSSVVGRPIEAFVEHFVVVRRASGGTTKGESLGWESGAGPDAGAWVGPVPDALIPVDLAPAWASYPMHVEPRSNGIVWLDLNVPRDQPPGTYRGAIDVRSGDRSLASLPVELEIADATLPDRTVGTMLYYDPDELARRVGAQAEEHLFRLLHAHRVAPLHDVTSQDDLRRQARALDGSLYTRGTAYRGPAPSTGDGVVSLGAYGAFGEPDEGTLRRIQSVADEAADLKLFGSTDVFLYAADEQCSSPWGAGWRKLLRGSDDPNVRRLRVAWTCSQDPTAQPVDIPIVQSTYDPAQVHAARGQGKETWVYNGVLPHAGTFLLDADAVSPRVNGWLSAMFQIPRWFYWESTYWYGLHGETPIDPFDDPESMHNKDGDWANGDGVLVYPGRQLDAFTEHSLGLSGVVPSFRLKNWRRGIEDAGYLQMARARDPARADAIARWLVPAAFGEAKAGQPPAWSSRGAPYFEARRALLALVLGRAPVVLGELPVPHRPVGVPARVAGCSRGASTAGGVLVLGLVVAALGLARVRRRRSAS